MGLIVTIPPASTPVSLLEAKAQCRIEDTSSDTLLTSWIGAATEYLERQSRQAFVPRTYCLTLDRFPCERAMNLPCPPLQSVTAINYTDANGTSQTLPTTAYTVDTTTRPGRIVLNGNWCWPATSPDANAVRVTFTAGYLLTPDLAKAVIKLLVSHWYEQREAAGEAKLNEIPFGVQSIINMLAFPEAVG